MKLYFEGKPLENMEPKRNIFNPKQYYAEHYNNLSFGTSVNREIKNIEKIFNKKVERIIK